MVADMGDFRTTGAFGVDVGALKCLLTHGPMAHLITDSLQRVLVEGCEPSLLATLLTPLPKPGKDPGSPTSLRLISVTSIWFRIIMRIFFFRLRTYLTSILSVD